VLSELKSGEHLNRLIFDVLRQDELISFPSSRDNETTKRETLLSWDDAKERHYRYNETLSAQLCGPSKGTYVCKEPRFWGTQSRPLGYLNYIRMFAPQKPKYMTEPPVVGDFTACTFYGCESRDPTQGI